MGRVEPDLPFRNGPGEHVGDVGPAFDQAGDRVAGEFVEHRGGRGSHRCTARFACEQRHLSTELARAERGHPHRIWLATVSRESS